MTLHQRAGVARTVLGPTARTSQLWTIVAAGAVGLLTVWLTARRGVPAPDLVLPLRIAGVALAAGAAFVLDDAAAVTVASAPTGLPVRRALRVALALTGVAAVWSGLVAYAAVAAVDPSGGPFGLPVAGLTLEFVATVTVAWAIAATVAATVEAGSGGVAAGPAVLALAAVAALAPARWVMYPAGPLDPAWTDAHRRWVGVLVVGLLVLVRASRDPAKRGPLTSLRATPRFPASP
ncbi:MAG: hypothetical protein KY469_09895 [Actinobacteria bacterium]|nr:hypothetical protein [Actinomycetota bacterium]